MSVEMPCIYFSDGKCKKFSEPGYISYCAYAPCGYDKPSNADRIRSMSDEELADWFIKIQDDVADYYDGGHAVAPELPTMKNSWLDWLKEEAKDD